MNIFRLINKIEKSIINNSLLKISSNIVSFFKNSDYGFYIFFNEEIRESKFPSIYLVSYENSKILQERLKYENILSAGIYFGFIKKGVFYLSLEGIEFLRDMQLIADSNQITINEEGEKSILYGNDILKSFIIKAPQELKENDLIAVLNQNNEIIALAVSKIDFCLFDKLKSNQNIAKNLMDKGYYLRKKQ
ncbi:MAG: PUA domain-containing protein [Candidatus Hermodarchaeota archaeon]